MLQPLTIFFDLGQLLLRRAQLGLNPLQLQYASLTPDGEIAEIAHRRGGDGRYQQSAKQTSYATPDSHAATESQTESVSQEWNQDFRTDLPA
jgi:hypothetical protein